MTERQPSNSPSDLRPIGTEYEDFWPPSKVSTDTDGYYVTMKVTGHVVVATYGLGGPTRWAETIELVEKRRRRVVGFRFDLSPIYEDDAGGEQQDRGEK